MDRRLCTDLAHKVLWRRRSVVPCREGGWRMVCYRSRTVEWMTTPANNAMHLSVRPVTRVAAREAPHLTPPSGRAQGARPSRPAGDRGRWAYMKRVLAGITVALF